MYTLEENFGILFFRFSFPSPFSSFLFFSSFSFVTLPYFRSTFRASCLSANLALSLLTLNRCQDWCITLTRLCMPAVLTILALDQYIDIKRRRRSQVGYILTGLREQVCLNKAQVVTALGGQPSVKQDIWKSKSMFRFYSWLSAVIGRFLFCECYFLCKR